MSAPAHPIQFISEGVSEDAFVVRRMTGREAMNKPYEFELELISGDANIDPEKILSNRASLIMKTPIRLGSDGDKWGLKNLIYHGVVRHFSFVEREAQCVVYRAELVPGLWEQSLTHQSRVFLDTTVPDMIEGILKKTDNAKEVTITKSRGYPEREFIVQYEETDLAFISRWLEHEGQFLYFSQGDAQEVVQIGDANEQGAPYDAEGEITFQQHVGTDARVRDHEGGDENVAFYREPFVQMIRRISNRLPKTVTLNEYNWRTPSTPLKVEHTVSNKGTGNVYEYNNHYKEEKEGKELVRVRAEELVSRNVFVVGTSDARGFRPGHWFNLGGHYRTDLNGKFFLTAVTHEAAQEVISTQNPPVAAPHSFSYTNEFVAVDYTSPYRQPREVEWPSIHGVMHGRIDGAGSAQYAEIDDMGRYKVKLPFDLADTPGGKASRFVRMAQPYAGGGMGMHFPLHKGTEVLLTFMDGDPDRPVIAGAVPNPETASPVTGGNHTQSVIQTGGQNKIVIEDQAGNERIKMETPHESTVFQLGSPNFPNAGAALGTAGDVIMDAGRAMVNVARNDMVNTAVQGGVGFYGSLGVTLAAGMAAAPGLVLKTAGDFCDVNWGKTTLNILKTAADTAVAAACGAHKANMTAAQPAGVSAKTIWGHVPGALLPSVNVMAGGGGINLVTWGAGTGDIFLGASTAKVLIYGTNNVEVTSPKVVTMSGKLGANLSTSPTRSISLEPAMPKPGIYLRDELRIDGEAGKWVDFSAGDAVELRGGYVKIKGMPSANAENAKFKPGDAEVMVDKAKGITLGTKKGNKIIFEVGESKIEMTEKDITITSKDIKLITTGKPEGKVEIGNTGNGAVKITGKGDLHFVCDGAARLHGKSGVTIDAKMKKLTLKGKPVDSGDFKDS